LNGGTDGSTHTFPHRRPSWHGEDHWGTADRGRTACASPDEGRVDESPVRAREPLIRLRRHRRTARRHRFARCWPSVSTQVSLVCGDPSFIKVVRKQRLGRAGAQGCPKRWSRRHHAVRGCMSPAQQSWLYKPPPALRPRSPASTIRPGPASSTPAASTMSGTHEGLTRHEPDRCCRAAATVSEMLPLQRTH
jgi:hypothetical protein